MRLNARTRLVIVAVLPFVLLAVVLLLAKRVQRVERDDIVRLADVPAPQAGSPDCAKLLGGLPDRLGPFSRAKLADPAPAGAAAWRSQKGELVELRCGVPRPDELRPDSAFQEVSAVKWLRVGEGTGHAEQTWVAVDRPVYVRLGYDPGVGTTAPVQAVSDAISKTLPATSPDYAGGKH
ncbi:DUF3515 domain-containing protein [Segniliparus rugosus]|uniref:DUF3515 domain-containing protein n=1 Tax=Segniliparus rugosus (strain ATCC BAA-974 / DSM 45345 / CCUG 50838 / CIP 108380 / JCM 13579 / CDC 945) TaxID=679197 RepID=E5XMG8_SEGRC|nr:DUF3515 domain-containing protein [Segniliparus rugosus]EFV14461.2 hypothetical protein HMPREF9336_00688 [Segniliparus rugosus ATCC BAA-974]